MKHRSKRASLALLLATAPAFGQTVTLRNGALETAVNNAPGTAVFVVDGEVFFSKSLVVKTGQRFMSVRPPTTRPSPNGGVEYVTSGTLTFSTAGDRFSIAGSGVKRLDWDGVSMNTPGGGFLFDGNPTDISIRHSSFKWGNQKVGYNGLLLRAFGYARITLSDCYFHDSVDSDRLIDIGWGDDYHEENNTFYLVSDCGHMDGRTRGTRVTNNFGTKIRRMGIMEWQDQGTDATTRGDDNVFSGNVFYDWYVKADWESYAASLVSQRATRTRVTNNFLATGHWDAAGNYVENIPQGRPSAGGVRYGCGIETGWDPATGIIQGNTLVGIWDNSIPCMLKDTPLKDNKSYGTRRSGHFTGWPGLYGTGSVKDLGGNLIDADNRHAPKPPRWSPSTQPTPPDPTPNPTTKPSAQAFFTFVRLKDLPAGQHVIERRAGDGVWSPVPDVPVLGPGLSSFDDKNHGAVVRYRQDQVANKWRFWFRVDGGAEFPAGALGAQVGVNADPVVPVPDKQVTVVVTLPTGVTLSPTTLPSSTGLQMMIGVPSGVKVTVTTRPSN